jgi:zinc transporter ZupT
MRVTALLGLAIPLALALTVTLPVPGELALGFLTVTADGVLVYMGAAHLLPEAQAVHPSRVTGGIFVLALMATTASLMLILDD